MTRLITDAQVHLQSGTAQEHPGAPTWVRELHRPGALTAEDLLKEMDEAGVARGVIVSPASEGDRNDLALAGARAHPTRFAVMGRLPLEQPDPAGVAGWRNEQGMLGVRLTFSREPHSLWLTNGVADWFWSAAEEAGIPVMLAAAGQLDRVGEIATRHPGLRLIVDHLGLAVDLKGQSVGDALKPVLRLAEVPNIAAKASALPFYASDPYPFLSLHGHVRDVIEAFTPQRVMWGTDITRLPCSYVEAVTMFTEHLDFLSEDDLDWIMSKTAEEWLDWPRPQLVAG